MSSALKIRARVKNGRLLVDEPTNLPDGMEIDLIEDDPYADSANDTMTEEQHRELSASLKRGMDDIKAGRGIPAEDVIRELLEP